MTFDTRGHNLARLKEEKLRLLEEKQLLLEALPHRYAHKFYKWQREFFECRDHMSLLTAANQIGKSTVQIKKCIEWAINKALWPQLWPGRSPNLFWYMYPSKELASIEFQTKWIPLLPRGKFKDHPEYGWKAIWSNKRIEGVQFNSGIYLSFKVYEQEPKNLQANTVFAVFADEEMPEEFYPEIRVRTQNCDGYLSMVFTATIGQEFWRLAVEPREDERPNFPNARKWQISLYDCMEYEDGSPGQYDEEKIDRAIANCGTQNEILKRIFGRFVVAGGRTYEAFSASGNMMDPVPVPAGWKRYAGIDSGSGGEESAVDSGGRVNDPAAIVFVCISPDYKMGYVYDAWRGDGVLTTSADIIAKYLSMRGSDAIEITTYDYSDKDLHTIASRMGESFVKADKSHERGEGILNTLFKGRMLWLFRDGEILKLQTELTGLLRKARKPVDHLSDALRYACVLMPWDFSHLGAKTVAKEPEETRALTPAEARDFQNRERRGEITREPTEDSIELEFEEFNDLYE